MNTPDTIHQKIVSFLNEYDILYSSLTHDPTPTCEESAAARGEDIKIGGKTLLLKDRNDFRLFVLSAAKSFDSQKARKLLRSPKLRFASKDELKDLVGVDSGALPPFGRPLIPFDLYIDPSILDNDKIAFNAGLLTCSFIMNTQDWFNTIKAEAKVESFTK
ncbi:MAG: hypothetical protein NXH75_07600 [Halobacteriovoraceae bacterium]|nr:hypothetical protein [Halobacteriovoraceae bacterium]